MDKLLTPLSVCINSDLTDMSNSNSPHEARVAVLVDCDNVPTDIVEHALLMVAQFGRVVLRRGYGNHNTLANKWQEGNPPTSSGRQKWS
ncbi:hypothetical protein [Xanthomonas axonopodis]